MVVRHVGVWCLLLCTMCGCSESLKPLRYLGEPQGNYYKDVTNSIAYPDVSEPTPEQVTAAEPPHTLIDPAMKGETWDLTLTEAVHQALANNTIIRARQANTLALGDRTPSVYDQSIQETGVLFGTRGVEAALSAFDTQFNTSMTWGRAESVANTLFFGPNSSNTLKQETGAFNAGLRKQFATGGTMSLNHIWNYSGTNAQAQLFPSSYSGNLGASYRQPLWAGAGTEFSRIAGPLNPVFSAITGVSQGVIIARINGDITLADFEASVLNLVKDVEDTYWDLQLAYHSFHTAVEARNSAQESWRVAKVTDEAGGGRKIDEPQARDQYFESRAAVENALNAIYATETELRRLMGIEVSSRRVIRPITKLTQVELKTDWHVSLAEALTRRVELRKQKWNIKSLELQLRAARSLTNPRLDFVSNYQINAFGDHLFAGSDNDSRNTQQGFNSAYETLTQGNQTAWTLGFEFSLPLGFRSARSQVRNLELRMTKAREVLTVQEMEIAHQLANVIQNLATFHATAQSHYNRYLATQERVNIVQLEYTNDKATLDEVLRAQRSRASAEAAYYQNLVNYNKAITQLHLAKGTLLEYNNIQLQENEWDPAAYEQALRRSWARSYGMDATHVYSDPEVFAFDMNPDAAAEMDEQPISDDPPIPVPEPTPVPKAADDPTDKAADKAADEPAKAPEPAPAAAEEPSEDQSANTRQSSSVIPASAQEPIKQLNWQSPIVRKPPILGEPKRIPRQSKQLRRAAKLPVAKRWLPNTAETGSQPQP